MQPPLVLFTSAPLQMELRPCEAPREAKYPEHKPKVCAGCISFSLCNGCISLSSAEGLFLSVIFLRSLTPVPWAAYQYRSVALLAVIYASDTLFVILDSAFVINEVSHLFSNFFRYYGHDITPFPTVVFRVDFLQKHALRPAFSMASDLCHTLSPVCLSNRPYDAKGNSATGLEQEKTDADQNSISSASLTFMNPSTSVSSIPPILIQAFCPP